MENTLYNIETSRKTISSREVAEMMGEPKHKNMLRKIDALNEILTSSNLSRSDYWTEGQYKAGNGEMRREYQVTKKGCELIAHKTEGEKGVIFTVKYMDRFEEMEKALVKPMTEIEILKHSLDILTKQDKRISNIENTMTIDYGQQLVLENLVKEVVLKHLGGKNSRAYKHIAKKVFAECNRDLKNHFNVNSRRNIARLDYKKACAFILEWEPSLTTQSIITYHNENLRFWEE